MTMMKIIKRFFSKKDKSSGLKSSVGEQEEVKEGDNPSLISSFKPVSESKELPDNWVEMKNKEKLKWAKTHLSKESEYWGDKHK